MKAFNFIYLKLTILILLALPLAGIAGSREDISFIQSVLGNVNKPQNTYVCGALIHEQKSCSYLFNLFERDRDTGMFFGMISESPWDSCKKNLPSSKEISLAELEAKLAENNRTGLGLRNNYFSSKVEECLPKEYKRKNADVEAQSKLMLTMGYDYLNRIKKSTGQIAEEIKTLNSIVGDPIDTGLPCGEFSMPHDAKICQDIKNQKCKSLNEIENYTGTLFENAIEPLIALKSTYKALSDSFSKARTLRRPENQAALLDIQNKIKSIENQFPVLKGKSLKPFLDKETADGKIPARNKLQAAVKAQLVENRANLSKKLDENIDMDNCLVYGDSSFCKNFDKNFERIPSGEDVAFFEKDTAPAKRLKNRAASELYSTNQCVDNFRGLKTEFNNFAAEFSINVGLTVFTAGSGLIVKAAGQSVKVAMATHKALLVADAAFLAHGVDDAIETCSKELNKLESAPNVTKTAQANVCPMSLASPEHTVIANYQGCVTGAMLASLNALPFVPAAVSKYLARVKAPKANGETVSGLGSLLKFKTPKKAFDPYDLKSTGTIFPAGKAQNASEVFKRDGVYVYIVDEKGNMVISHRTPDLNAGTKEGDQFLGTHRGLFNKLAEQGGDVTVVAAGEIRVVGGVPTRVSPRAGSFHSTPEEVLAAMKQTATAEDKAAIDSLMKEYKKLSPADRANSMIVDMHMEDFLELNPSAKAAFEKMQKAMIDLTDKRLESAKEAMASKGLLPKDVETKFVREVSGDAHIEGKAAAIAEINCSKTKSCADQLDAYQKVAKKFMTKYKSPENCEDAVVNILKRGLNKTGAETVKDRAFLFFNRRSSLLFKEGPIEFMQNARPDAFGLTEQEALKYLDEWSKQF